MDLLHTNIFYQYLVGYLLNLIMYWFFQILSLHLLIFCIDDQEYNANQDFHFHYYIHQNLLFIRYIILLFLLQIFPPNYWELFAFFAVNIPTKVFIFIQIFCMQIYFINIWLFIKFNNVFVFPDPEPPIINILYGWSGIYDQSRLCFIFISIFIKIYHL